MGMELMALKGFSLVDSVDQGAVQVFREAPNLLVLSLNAEMPNGFGVKPEQRCSKTHC